MVDPALSRLSSRTHEDETVANLITVSRFPVLIALVLLLFSSSPGARLSAVFVVVLLIGMDTLDGMVARRRKEESLLGSVLDIMADRAVELVLWICFAQLGSISVAIPLIYVLRGVVVDSLRSVHVSSGSAPFKAMRTRLGIWLVGSPAMRSSYGVSKLISFTGLALTHALALYAAHSQVAPGLVDTLGLIFTITSWISVAFCLARGIPVIIESFITLSRSQ